MSCADHKGHGGATPEELMTTGPDQWWKDVMDAYKYFQDRGHKEIAVGGLSLGGVFSLKLGYTVPIKGIVPMCAPAYIKSEQIMYEGVLQYARNYKKIEGKSPEEIEKEMNEFQKIPIDTIKALQNLIADVRDHIDMIYAPLFVVQARNDGMINTEVQILFITERNPRKKKSSGMSIQGMSSHWIRKRINCTKMFISF